MQSKKFVLVAQCIITGMMACLMTGIFSLMHFGLSVESAKGWISTFVVSWPLAFALSTVIAPLGIKITSAIVKDRSTA